MTIDFDAQTDALQRRLEELEARESVRASILAGARALDRLDAGLLRAQFHDDAQVDYGAIYRGAIDGFVPVAMSFQGNMRDTHHMVGLPRVELAGERAFAETYVQAHHVIVTADGERSELVVGGRYLDLFERRDGLWLIAYRTEVLDWARQVRVTETWFEDQKELASGRRDPEDLSYRVAQLLRGSPEPR